MRGCGGFRVKAGERPARVERWKGRDQVSKIEMTRGNAKTNPPTYDAPEVAAHYAGLEYLTAAERMLFEAYVRPDSAILDLGVGGGRTTPFLARRASRYIGVDNATAMVTTCREKFPGLEFVLGDAADLKSLAPASFDAVVFSFNGIDYVLPDESRKNCLEHIYRVLRPGGVLIFSSHNPRAVIARRGWNRERLETIARRLAASSLFFRAVLAVLTLLRAGLALLQGAGATLWQILTKVPTRVFWVGAGSLVDPTNYGLLTHYSTPRLVIREVESLHFRLQSVVAQDYPHEGNLYTTGWYYYVFTKPCAK